MYANVIVDISHEKLDKTFQYSIPDELLCDIRPGVCVDIPFGSRTITGYVIEVTDKPEYDPCLLYTSPSPRDRQKSRMPSSAWKKKKKKSQSNDDNKQVW